MSEETGLQTKGLENILKMFKSNATVKVGILGEKNSRSGSMTNAQIGAMHEFGTTTIPKRSFLREPISDNLDKELKKAGLLDKKVIAKIIKESSAAELLAQVGILAEGIIADAFATGGFGKWPAWKTKGYENNTGNILVDTQQLRNSITSEVVENG